jgi:hypothetical protein
MVAPKGIECRTKAFCTKGCIRLGEVGMVEEIEEFCTKLKALALGQRCLFDNGGINLFKSGALDGIASRVAKSAARRYRPGIGIQPGLPAFAGSIERLPRDDVGALICVIFVAISIGADVDRVSNARAAFGNRQSKNRIVERIKPPPFAIDFLLFCNSIGIASEIDQSV